MYSISEAAGLTGINAYTLRYYEKIGLLPSPDRQNGGKRSYTEGDLKLVSFIKSLKDTGMSLEDIQEFIKGGCILDQIKTSEKIQLYPSLNKRIAILTKHIKELDRKKAELEQIILTANEKLGIYQELLANEHEGEEV
ncbi:MerR family transcriptional regulator [Falsibacillus pallidus]|uniref:MerR family transcriptional regulator n=2 Tax=Falsibacillus pallidus TaxID=493781 RepID=A0A370G5M1_9BACI|nr:MerR family transcriptional regulator [Falsibacillus pallidus]